MGDLLMNVIIANKYKDMLMGLNIEIIKSMEGVFEVDEIIDTFSNFYFDRMILDITAIKNYTDLDNLAKAIVNTFIGFSLTFVQSAISKCNIISTSKNELEKLYNYFCNIIKTDSLLDFELIYKNDKRN